MNTRLLQLHTTSVHMTEAFARLIPKDSRWRTILSVVTLFVHSLEERLAIVSPVDMADAVTLLLYTQDESTLDHIADRLSVPLDLRPKIVRIVEDNSLRRESSSEADGPKPDRCRERVELTVPAILEYTTEKQRDAAFSAAMTLVRGFGVARIHSINGYSVEFPKVS